MYETNPSVPQPGEINKSRRRQLGTEHRGLIMHEDSGEILGVGGAVVYEWEDVDKERFVKLFSAGVKQAVGMPKAGLTIFELVYNRVREQPNADKIDLSFRIAKKLLPSLHERTYQRGVRELLEREFLFRTIAVDTFFINIRHMFNGDRLAFVQAYQLREPKKRRQGASDQSSLLPPRD